LQITQWPRRPAEGQELGERGFIGARLDGGRLVVRLAPAAGGGACA